MSLLTQTDKEKLLSEITDPEKIVLTCGTHHFVYNPNRKRHPVWGCKQCWMVQYVGLLANTPPNKRDEVLEMLEYSVNKLVEADKKGEIDHMKLFAHPEVTITKE